MGNGERETAHLDTDKVPSPSTEHPAEYLRSLTIHQSRFTVYRFPLTAVT
jgi:hypothetical protein